MSIDELSVMDGSKCVVQVRGVRPFLSDKYDLTQHPNYKLTADADKKNWFDVEKFLSHKVVLKPDDEYEVIEVTEVTEASIISITSITSFTSIISIISIT